MPRFTILTLLSVTRTDFATHTVKYSWKLTISRSFQLHELFRTLSGSDESDSKDPLPPSNFLSAVGKLNPMFEGNQQQDAHEMLGYILNLLQEIKIPAAASLSSGMTSQ